MRVDNIQAETTITEQGERVYSPNNKPSPADIGALASGGVAETAKIAETVRNTNIGTTATAYISIPNAGWYANAPVGRSQMVKADSYGLPIASHGYVFKTGARDIAGGSSWIFASDYAGVGTRIFFGICETSNHDPKWHEVYSPNHKPTAADVGAHPTSWKPTWNDVSSKPAFATRWPTWGEVTGKPATMPPSSHTHPWSQITGEPVYTQRWPTWGEVSGKPSNLLDQSTADARYLGKTSAYTKSESDGKYANIVNNVQNTIDITVGGDKNTYYPVLINRGGTDSDFHWFNVGISRGYSWTAPNDWNTSTHKGGLTLAVGWSGDGRWGGNDHNLTVYEFHESYTTVCGGIELSTGGLIVWLRGGGALYRIHSDYGQHLSAQVHLTTYTAPDKLTYSGRTKSQAESYRNSTIMTRWNNRGGQHVYDSNNRVYSPVNKPSAGDVGAYSKSEGDSRYIRFDYSGSSEYARVIPPKSNWVRAPLGEGGFLPYLNGQSYLGTSSWRWRAVYANAIYDNNQRVYSPVNKPSAATLGCEPTLAGDRKRKITYGTGNPSGGSDGDVYIQYK